MRLILPTLAVLLALGCANKRHLEPTPAWQTERGKETTRLEIAEALIEADAITEGLQVIAKMRSDGLESAELDYLQGFGLARSGVSSEAERLLLGAADKMRNDSRPWRALGLLYADTDRHSEAIDAYIKAAERDENDPAVWNNLGFLQMSEKRYDDATESLQKAVSLDGSVPRYRNNLGFAYAAKGRYDEALRTFRSTGSHADAYANLALAYELAGDADSARSHFQQALEYSPSHAPATEGLARLDSPEEESP